MNFLRFSYPKPDLSTYSNGYKGKCTISYVDHNADEPTYIIDHDRLVNNLFFFLLNLSINKIPCVCIQDTLILYCMMNCWIH